MSPEHPSILTWTADKECPPSPTRTPTLYPEPVAAESSPPADFPLLARLDHVRAWLRDHPDTARHVCAVDVSTYRPVPLVWVTVSAGLAPLLAIGAPTRIDPWRPGNDGGVARNAYLDLDGLTVCATQRAGSEDLDRALATRGVR